MIVAQFVKSGEAVMRVERIENYHTMYFSVLRKLVDTGDLDGHLTIKLDETNDDILPVALDLKEKQLRLRLAFVDNIEQRKRIIMQAACIMDDPADFDMEFFMLYPSIMAGVRDGVTSKWGLSGVRVYSDHIECGYTDGKRLHVVCLRDLTAPLTVEIANSFSWQSNEVLQIMPMPSGVMGDLPEERYHPTIGEMKGYKVQRIESVEVPASWESLSVVRNQAEPDGTTYLLERHRTLDSGDKERVRRQIVSDQEGCIAYRF